jgi:hypothetical protein
MPTYLDSAAAAPLFGLPGMANLLTVLPSAGHSAADVRRALLDVPHVASAQSVRVATTGRASLDQFTGILNVAAGVALLLVLLIAYGTASIGTDERWPRPAPPCWPGWSWRPSHQAVGQVPPLAPPHLAAERHGDIRLPVALRACPGHRRGLVPGSPRVREY